MSFGFEPAANDGVRQEATFRVVPGLAGRCASLEWTNAPNYFLRHRDGQLTVAPGASTAGSNGRRRTASRGARRNRGSVSFEALSVPNSFIRYRDSALWLDPSCTADRSQDGCDLCNRAPTDPGASERKDCSVGHEYAQGVADAVQDSDTLACKCARRLERIEAIVDVFRASIRS